MASGEEGWTGWADSSDVGERFTTSSSGRNCTSASSQGPDGNDGFAPVRYQVLRKGLAHDDGPQALHELLFCESCNRLLTRHLRDTVCEIESYYCPQSLEILPSSEAIEYRNKSSRVFSCPDCPNVLSTHASFPVYGGAGQSGDDKTKFRFVCLHCRWDSLDIGLVADSPEELRKAALAKEGEASSDGLVAELTKIFKAQETKQSTFHTNLRVAEDSIDKLSPNDELGLWRWEECDAALNSRVSEFSKARQMNKPSSVAKLHERDCSEAGKVPGRPNLRTKLAFRCRQCVNAGLPNIILKPQINPLKGDTSMRTNVGAWFKKKSVAYDRLPRIVARHVGEYLWLAITNPVDNEMTITIEANDLESGPITLNAFDDVEELDLFSGRRPAKAGNPLDTDPASVCARLANKVLLKIAAPTLPWSATASCKLSTASTLVSMAAAAGQTESAKADSPVPASGTDELFFQLHVGY